MNNVGQCCSYFMAIKFPKYCVKLSHICLLSVNIHASPNNFFSPENFYKISIDKLGLTAYCIYSIDVLFDSGGNYITFLE